MNKPKEFWLIPWSVGFECRTAKPEGDSIPVIEKEAFDVVVEKFRERMAYTRLLEDKIYKLEAEVFSLECEVERMLYE